MKIRSSLIGLRIFYQPIQARYILIRGTLTGLRILCINIFSKTTRRLKMWNWFQTVFSVLGVLFYIFVFGLIFVCAYKMLTKKNYKSRQQDNLLEKEKAFDYIKKEPGDKQDKNQ